MKKSINTALLSMLFVLGACSAAKSGESAFSEKFLNNVKGKFVYTTETSSTSQEALDDLFGAFSDDGSGFEGIELTKTIDEDNGVYKGTIEGKKLVVTFSTTDGETGILLENIDGQARPEQKIWFETIKRK